MALQMDKVCFLFLTSYLSKLLNVDVSSKITDLSPEADAEWPRPPDLRDFLLQSSDEENQGFELSDPQLDSEAEVMAYFYKNQTNGAQQLEHTSLKYSRYSFFKSINLHRMLLKNVEIRIMLNCAEIVFYYNLKCF